MSKYLLLIISLFAVFIAGCASNVEVTNFDECVKAGGDIAESYPRKCFIDNQSFIEEVEFEEESDLNGEGNSNLNTCSQEDKQNQICTREYNPVCGDDGKTYPTACVGCSSGNIDSWEEGQCNNGSTTESTDFDDTEVTNFDECVEAGNPVMTSYPAQCNHEGNHFVQELSKQELCENLNGGTWVADFNECEYISQENCENLGGTFSECESACRNNPEAEMCTMQCVLVCDFE